MDRETQNSLLEQLRSLVDDLEECLVCHADKPSRADKCKAKITALLEYF